jgi:AcrR family transcriptional regulator
MSAGQLVDWTQVTQVLTPWRTGSETHSAILRAAAETFRAEGYDLATLDGIASRLGMTRAAVLSYFPSKEALLHEIVVPFIRHVDALLDRFAAHGTRSLDGQRRFLTEMIDFVCDNRTIASMLSRDRTASAHLGPDLQIAHRVGRFAELLSTDHQQSYAAVAALSAIGAVMRPLSAPDDIVDLRTHHSREVIVEMALAALRDGLREGQRHQTATPPFC